MLTTFYASFPIFLLIVTGFIFKKYFYSDESFWKTIESMTYYVFFPCLLVLHVASADFSSLEQSSFLVAIVIAVTLLIGIAVFTLRKVISVEDGLFTSIFQGSTRYNSYVFIGLTLALYGGKGISVAGVFMTYMIIFTNALNVVVLNLYGDGNKKNVSTIFMNLAKNPLILASLFGLLLNVCGIKITGPVHDFADYLGAASSPLSLLSVGAGLRLCFNKQKLLAIFSSTALKLVAMPLLTYICIVHFRLTGVNAQIALLYACVPTAGNAYILARQMGGDADAMASIITATTICSAATSLFFIGLV